GMRGKAVLAGAVFLLFSVAVRAQPVVYSWEGMGTTVPGSSKCATYHMAIEVMVDGKVVRGVLKQQGRPERSFEATKDAMGNFKAKVQLASDGSMDVTGSVSDKDGTGRILLDGYCKFEGRLSAK